MENPYDSPKNSIEGREAVLTKSRIISPTNKSIDSVECKESVSKIKQAAGDNKYYEMYRESMRSILKYVIMNRFISEKQIGYVEKYWVMYQKIKQLNEAYEPGLSDYTISLLEEVANFGKPHRKAIRALMGHISNNSMRTNHIRKGEYFWDLHLLPARSIIHSVKDHGIDNKDLEGRLMELNQTITLSY